MRVQWTLQRIFHPSDFSAASDVAFAHALKLALLAKASLTILHTGDKRTDDVWAEFPRVRRTLEKWQLLPPGSPREAIAGLGVDVEKVILPDTDLVRAIAGYLNRRPHDLIVLATHQRDGWHRWMHMPVAMPLARAAANMTLFIPEGSRGFVHADSGAGKLQNILIPVDRVPDPQFALDAAVTIAQAMDCQGASATLLHVGPEDEMPADLDLDSSGALAWRYLCRKGNVVDEILAAAEEREADLIVVSTQGRHGFVDALRGSTTERIVRNAKCPVLAAPVHEAAEPAPVLIERLATGQIAIDLG